LIQGTLPVPLRCGQGFWTMVVSRPTRQKDAGKFYEFKSIPPPCQATTDQPVSNIFYPHGFLRRKRFLHRSPTIPDLPNFFKKIHSYPLPGSLLFVYLEKNDEKFFQLYIIPDFF
jgi:hypothetical protein